MKRFFDFSLIIALFALTNFTSAIVFAADTQSGSSPFMSSPTEISPYAVVDAGPHHQIWQRVTGQTNQVGESIYHTNSYTQLATGLSHSLNGQWVPSSDQIQITGNGAVATNAQHQVFFAANANTPAAIDLVTPEGFHLQSHVWCLAYADPATGLGVVIADLQDSIGQLLPSGNQVLYTNALTNLADVRYTHSLAGFEQDIILRRQPPSPMQFDLNPATAKLQIWTEFINFPTPNIGTSTNSRTGLANQDLDFGVMKMGPGNAFNLAEENVLIPVSKHWLTQEGRTFLIEEVPYNLIAPLLQSLPQTAAISGPGKSTLYAGHAPYPLDHPVLSPHKLAGKGGERMAMAKSASMGKGFVLDYTTLNSSQTNYVFQSDTTYFISGAVNLYGSCVLEGGTVIKYSTNSSASIVLANPTNLVCQTGPYRMAIFTAQDDNSVGDTISGSTGSPSAYYGGAGLKSAGTVGTATFKGMRFSYLRQAMYFDFGTYTVYDSQFVNCQQGFYLDTVTLYLRNALLHNVSTNFYCVPEPCNLDLQNVTARIGSRFCNIQGYEDFGSDAWYLHGGDGPDFNISVVNCIVAAVTNVGTFTSDYMDCSLRFTNWTYSRTTDAGIFQAVGAGADYLADQSPYRNAGTTNIDATLLAELQQKSTYPPLLFSNVLVSVDTTLNPQAGRDISSMPDLGYHYDPIDYLVDSYAFTNAVLTLTNGVALACFNDSAGVWLQDGSGLVSFGSPLYPNWLARYSCVQEQPVGIGSSNLSSAITVNSFHYGTNGASGTVRFTKFACPAGDGYHLYSASTGSSTFNSLLVQDCEFYVGGAIFSGGTNASSATVVNNLFERSPVTAELTATSPSSFGFSNNLVWSAHVFLLAPTSGNWAAFNNDFDTCTIQRGSAITNGYNAYLNTTGRLSPTNINDCVSNSSLAYVSGPLGNYYQPSGSLLIDIGSTNANYLGLYHYTTQTNQVKETNTVVDMGYHYVALGTNGLPMDTSGSGLPDYLKDLNGNGLVDTGEINWTNFYDLGFRVFITKPKNNSNLP